jgi:hypothetical protein
MNNNEISWTMTEGWTSMKGKATPMAGNIVDVEISDFEWQRNIPPTLQVENIIGDPTKKRLIPRDSHRSSYIHLKGFKDKERKKRK